MGMSVTQHCLVTNDCTNFVGMRRIANLLDNRIPVETENRISGFRQIPDF